METLMELKLAAKDLALQGVEKSMELKLAAKDLATQVQAKEFETQMATKMGEKDAYIARVEGSVNARVLDLIAHSDYEKIREMRLGEMKEQAETVDLK